MSAVPMRSGVQELRALDVVEVVPAGCMAVLVRSRNNLPHLKPGELAIIDPSDREPLHGELFAIRYRAGPAVMQTMFSMEADGTGYWDCAPLNRPRSRQECQQWLDQGREMHCSDGPYRPDQLREKVVGRVVGVMVPG